MRRRHTLCVASAKLLCAVRRIPPVASTAGRSGVQRLEFLVTFGAIAKSNWPRAAIERVGGERAILFSRPFDGLRANGQVAFNPVHSTFPLSLTLSLRGRGDRTSRRKGMGAGLR